MLFRSNVNLHSYGITARGEGTLVDGGNGAGYGNISSISAYNKIVKAGVAPAFTSSMLMTQSAAGKFSYFILPQLEEQPAATSLLPTLGATLTRTLTTLLVPKASNLPAYAGWELPLIFTPVQITGTQTIWDCYVDASNFLRLTHDGTKFDLIKRVGGTSKDVLFTYALVAGKSVKILVRCNSDWTFNLFILGTKDSGGANNNTDTTPLSLGANISIGTQGVSPYATSPLNGCVTDLRILRRQMADAECVSYTSLDV